MDSINLSLDLLSTVDKHTVKIIQNSKNGSVMMLIQLTIIHEGVLELGAGEADGAEVVEHHPGGAGVDHVPQAEVGHAVQEGEDVGARLLHGYHHDAVVLLGVVGKDRDDEVGVERVEVPGGLVQQQHHGVPHQLHPDHEAPVLRLGQGLHAVVGDLAQREVSQHLLHPGHLVIMLLIYYNTSDSNNITLT